MKRCFFLCFFLFFTGCREFYDEEFLEDEAAGGGIQGGVGSQAENVSYSVTLNSTDPNLPDITGSATVNVDNNNDNVTATINLTGIPQNIMQVHYAYVTADCQSIQFAIPNEVGTTRTYSINETTSATALAFDLRSSGASTSSSDTNLEGKSLVIRSFSNLASLPTNAGTNAIPIACGEILLANDNPTGAVGGAIGGTAAGTAGGVAGGVGGTVEGAVGGVNGGVAGGTVGGVTGGAIGGGTISGAGGTVGGVTGGAIGGGMIGGAGGTVGGTTGF